MFLQLLSFLVVMRKGIPAAPHGASNKINECVRVRACVYQCLVEVIFAPLVSDEYRSQDSILMPLSNRKALR